MGTPSKVVSACLRVLEFGIACVILGVVSRFIHVLNQGNGSTDSRLVFAISMAAISILFACLLVPPVKYSFYCFPLDFALFICWITCFALLEDYSSPERALARHTGSIITGPIIGAEPGHSQMGRSSSQMSAVHNGE
ncbi:hypothetical protein ACEPPN_015257 [Leptodophora sp. 'Broadleaf-Isolate-01']